MFNYTKETVKILLENNPNTYFLFGKYYINDIDNYDYLIYKDTFNMLFVLFIIRYICFNLDFITKIFFKKEIFIKIPNLFYIQEFIFIFTRKNYFKEMKDLFKGKYKVKELIPIIKVNPFLYVYDFMIMLIEIRLLYAIAFLIF